jgi:eukaryotic-like serine/threonine-protein kinase
MGDRLVARRTIGRYILFDEIAAGGMATVHFGRMLGAAGFARTVAIKRLHTQFAKDPEFVSMFIDEARLAARIAHPNVVSTIDIVNDGGEMLLVMDYVFGASLSHLAHKVQAKKEGIPPLIAVSIMTGALYGLHAAHEARSDAGEPLGIVHRDVSPQNILVGADGVARVVDFGVAKAIGRLQTTREGQVKGKAAYMAPEQIRALPVDARTDVYSASVVLWEALVGERLFAADHPMGLMNAVFEKEVPRVSAARPSVPSELDAIVAKGLSRDPAQRFATAREMAMALEAAMHAATAREVGDWVRVEAVDSLARRARRAAEIESSSGSVFGPPVLPGQEVQVDEVKESIVSTSGSHVSDATPRRRGSGFVAAGALALLLAGGGLAARSVWTRAPPLPSVTPPPAPATSVVETPSASPSSAPTPTATVGSSASPDDPTPVASATRPRSTPARPARPAPASNPPKARAPSCDPPYTVDRDGTRHWKDGC